MGQGQSLDSETDPGEPTRPDSGDQESPKLPGGKPRRLLWRDGSWTGTVGWSSNQSPETTANTVWYQDESPDTPPTEGATLLSQGKEVHAQTTGYGDNMAVNQTSTSLQSKNGHIEVSEQKESAVSRPRALGVGGDGDPLEPDPCFQVSVSALSQVRDSGAQAAQSHVPGAQRQEASGKQHDEGGREEGEAERKERGADGEVGGDDRRRANSEESFDREEAERGPEEGAEETADKGRKKKRRKRARRGAVEAKLSSSSSTESHVLMDTQAEAQTQPQSNSPTAETQAEIRVQPDPERDVLQLLGSGAADQGDPPSTERLVSTPVAQAVAGRAGLQPPSHSDSVLREEVDAGTMRLPSQTEDKSMDCSEPIVARKHTDSHSPAPNLDQSDSGSKEICEMLHAEGPDSTELSDISVPMEGNISIQPVELNTPAEDIESTISDLNVDVHNVAPTELDYGHSDATEFKGAFDVVELSEQNAELVAGIEPNNSSHVEALEAAKPNSMDQLPQCVATMETASPTDVACLLESTIETSAFMEAIQHEGGNAVGPPPQVEEGAADVSLLKTQEGSAEATETAHLGHCFGHVKPSADGPSEDKMSEVKGSETRRSYEEMREAYLKMRHSDEVVVAASIKSCMWNREEREGDDVIESSTEVHDIGKNENRREAETSSKDGEDNLRYNEELAATAVAVVTVAIASALANRELSQRLDDGVIEGTFFKEQTHIQPSVVVSSENKLPLDTKVQAAVSENQLANKLQAELATMLPTSKNHASHELSDTDEYCRLDDKVPADDECQLKKVEEPQDKESNLPSKQSVSEAHGDLKQSPEANIINTEVIAETISIENHCLDFDQDLTIEAGSPAQDGMMTSRELNEVLATQRASPTSESEGQLCQEDQVPSLVVDTGQGNGQQLDLFDSNTTENPRLKESTDDSPRELNCSLFEEPLCISHNPEHGSGESLVTHFLETESCEDGDSPETSKAGAYIAPASEACVTGSTVKFLCVEGERETHKYGSAEGEWFPLAAEVCSSGPPHSESQCKSSYIGAAAAHDDKVSNSSLPAGTCIGTAHSNSLPKESTNPVTPGDGMAQLSAGMLVLATPMEFQSSSFQHKEDHNAVMYDGDGMFQDQGGNVGSLDTVDGCKDPERTSEGEETQRIMVTAQEGSKTGK